MSYILDALRKAEKERKQGTLPDMMTVQDLVAEKPKKSYVGAYFLAAALFLNAGILFWWLGSSDTAKTTVSQSAKIENAPAPALDEVTKPAFETPTVPASLPAGSPEARPADTNGIPAAGRPAYANPDTRTPMPKEFPKAPDTWGKSATDRPAPGADTSKPAELPAEKAKQPEGADRPPAVQTKDLFEMPEENKIYKLAELPSSIRQGLPPFSVSALLYSSSPGSRMVRVNEHMLHEGQELAAGVRLEEITRDGLVFSYRKFRFYIAAK